MVDLVSPPLAHSAWAWARTPPGPSSASDAPLAYEPAPGRRLARREPPCSERSTLPCQLPRWGGAGHSPWTRRAGTSQKRSTSRTTAQGVGRFVIVSDLDVAPDPRDHPRGSGAYPKSHAHVWQMRPGDQLTENWHSRNANSSVNSLSLVVQGLTAITSIQAMTQELRVLLVFHREIVGVDRHGHEPAWGGTPMSCQTALSLDDRWGMPLDREGSRAVYKSAPQ